MHGRSTNLLNYDVNIQEIFDNKSAIPTRIRVKAENYKHKLIKYYPVEGNFYEYMNVIMPQIKSDIFEMSIHNKISLFNTSQVSWRED